MSLAVVRDLRERRAPAGPEELARFETDVLAGFVLARASAGLADGTISSDVGHLEQVRTWLGRPLWDMQLPGQLAWINERNNMNTATNPDSRWLFPGRRAGQPIHPESLAVLINTLGVPARTSASTFWTCQPPSSPTPSAIGELAEVLPEHVNG